jgi:polyhydroxyalkanoate synthesis regulator phasin
MEPEPPTIAPSLQNEGDNDLDKQAEWMKILIARLVEVLNRDDAKSWEQVYQIRDLTEQVQRFKRQLRDSLPIGDPDGTSQEAMSALEVAQEKMTEALRARSLRLEAEVGSLREELRAERSKGWDLTYQCQDLREEVLRLKMHLSHSITIGDWEEGLPVPKTARERALEEQVGGLERRIRDLNDKMRDRDVKMGYAEGSGRVRSRSV